MASARHPRTNFSQEDDAHLTEFLATYNPQPNGRQGTKHYIMLEENVGNKWPWAKRHSWQSWRERYKKNQAEFDHRIRRLQRQAGQRATVPAGPSRTVDSNDKKRKRISETGKEDEKRAKTVIERNIEVEPKAASTSRKTVAEDVIKARSKPEGARMKADDEEDEKEEQQSKDLGRNVVALSEPVNAPIKHQENGIKQPKETENGKVYPNIADVPQPGLEPEEPRIPGSFETTLKSKPSSQDVRLPQIAPPKYASSNKVKEPSTHATAAPNLSHPTKLNQQPQPTPTKKLKRKAVDVEEDFFGTPTPSSPVEQTTPAPKRQPPTYKEGPFRTTLQRGQDGNWPPKRRRKILADDASSEAEEPGVTAIGVHKGKAKEIVSDSTSRTGQPRQPVQANAIASSSRVLLSNIAEPASLLKSVLTKKVSLSSKANQGRDTANTKPGPSAVVAADAQGAPSARTAPSIAKSRTSVQDSAAYPVSATSPNDPFTARKLASGKGKGRANAQPVSDFLIEKPTRHIDLHHVRLSRRSNRSSIASRRSSVLSSRTSTSSTSNVRKRRSGPRQSLADDLSRDDQETLMMTGLPQVMASIAKEYGFDVRVAMNAFKATKSIENVRKTLKLMRDAAAAAVNALFAQDNDGNDADTESDEETIHRAFLNRRPSLDQQSSPAQKSSRHSSLSRKSKRPSLNIRHVPLQDDEETLSDYNPPNRSRAGEFARLVKQGRVEEAYQREGRRVSGVSPIPVTQIQAKEAPSSPRGQDSPTPHARDIPIEADDDDNDKADTAEIHDDKTDTSESPDVEDDDPDDIYEQEAEDVNTDGGQHLTDDEVEEHSQEVESDSDSSPRHPNRRVLVKRISEGDPSFNERRDDPAFVALAKKHRDLVMDVTTETADVLRKFEEENNPDLMRLWSLDWAKLKISSM
ncbi:hypothetical protein B0H34DRAFT_794478 [Crassisporium funariophilum]|nr:hypothetical protein B0H34DRAFT_794478 [Crassisporium funariophilum]